MNEFIIILLLLVIALHLVLVYEVATHWGKLKCLCRYAFKPTTRRQCPKCGLLHKNGP